MHSEPSGGLALIGFAFRVAVATFVVAALGFPIFVWSLARTSIDPENAEAIVALTGGAERLSAALELLDRGKGDRLLISGVHAETTRQELLEAVGQPAQRAACCVDLGRGAESTIGNASETASWAEEHGYKSLIVVTASYHMPRSLLELHATMPRVKLVAYPVFPESVQLDGWWHDPLTTGVLAWEYVKLLGSTVRVAFATEFWSKAAPAVGPTTIEPAPGAPKPVESAATSVAQ